jgi:diguanylate cyclase (GGDEF)-like protein
MRWNSSRTDPGRNASSKLPGDQTEPGGRKRGSLAMTAALAGVLIGLCSLTFWGALLTTQATTTQSHALVLDAMFSEARNAVTVEEMHTRQYQLEPSAAGQTRYLSSAKAADDALRYAAETGTGPARNDALRLRQEQADYRIAADRMITLVTDRDPRSVEQDRLEVAPAYYTLQQDADSVSRAYHSEAQRLVADLRNTQTRILIATAIGFAIGLGLVAMIWRVVLGYQRRLLDHAQASQRLALHDSLTGLPNRAMFERRLHAALTGAQVNPDQQLAVMLIDLNGFKGVNDTLGHHAGDEVLIEAGRRLLGVMRDDDIVARFGGDEFAVLLPTVPDLSTAKEIAERAAGALRRNFILPAGSAAVSGSVGVVLARHDDGLSIGSEELLRHADAAMYRAKTSGNGMVVYDKEVDTDSRGRMGLFSDLRALLDAGDPDGELVLYYQPQVGVNDCQVRAAEALVRWNHPELGLLLPAAFLPVAETGGLETRLTYHLLRIAVGEAARWGGAGRPLVVAVNVSPNCLLDDAFVGQIRSALTDCGLPPSLLRLEVTEGGMMSDPDRAIAVLGSVQEHGVQVSIDDFGAGFSSLVQLKRITADELKIDRAFIQELATDPGDAVLVRSAIDLAHNLELVVTAEGVEDLAAMAILRELGCDQAQGFALARPVPADALPAACVRAEKNARAAFALAVSPPSNTEHPGGSGTMTSARGN